MTRVDPSRRAAYDLLHAVGAGDAYANIVWPSISRGHHLAGRDAAFATELAYGTLRWRGLYDVIIEDLSTRPMNKLDPMVIDVLRLGMHQLLSMRVPTHAAVSETVTLAKELRGTGASGLVNAILRKTSARTRNEWIAALAPESNPGHLACAWSHPAWIVSAFRDALGADWSEVAELLEVDNTAAPVTLVAKGIATTELLDDDRLLPGLWSPWAVRLAAGSPDDIPAVTSGLAGVQDEGSQLMVQALLNVDVSGDETRWLDMCAGPGGKAALLATLAQRTHVQLTAIEQHPHRVELIRSALGELPATLITGDATSVDVAGEFDRVLVDVPCTGIGVVRRRPDLRWRRRPADVSRLAPLQRDLLHRAIDLTRPGGVIGYVTCSPHIAETDLVVDDVIGKRDDVEQVDARDYLPDVPELGAGPAVRLWPHRHDTDGMYLALLRKR